MVIIIEWLDIILKKGEFMSYCIVVRDDIDSHLIEKNIKEKVSLEYNNENPDIVVAIGGDGTIIKATHLYPSAIIFGVHTGHLGFYANYSKDEIDLLINDINSNSFEVEKLKKLTCEIEDFDGKVIHADALNEITVVTPPRTLILDVSIDNEFLERFRGTGLCISTPSGSTAYNKSLGGGVVDSTLDIMQLTEMAGINSNSYRTLSSPLILASNRRIELKSIGDVEVYITIDHLNYLINHFKSIVIYYDKKVVKMAYHNHENFLKRIKRTFLINND